MKEAFSCYDNIPYYWASGSGTFLTFSLFNIFDRYNTMADWDSHGLCDNTNRQLSWTNTRPRFPNTRLNFWLSLKHSNAWPSVSKARLRVSNDRFPVLRKMLGRVFWSTGILKIFKVWSVKVASIYLIKPLNFQQCFPISFQFGNLPFSLNLFLFFSTVFSFSDIDY